MAYDVFVRIRVCANLLFLGAVLASGQSTDPKHPTPLAPGFNKGNVDNIAGPHYYYATVGPGHFDVKMAFREMGLFGNPLRQGLNFDFKNEAGQMVSHNAIVSQGKLEHLSTTGDLPNSLKVILVLTAEQGAIRKGGYYEVEITGAVRFDAAKAAGADAKPIDTALVHPVGPLTNGPVELTHPGQQLVYPGQALTVTETPRETRLVLAADVLFDFDSAVLRPEARAELHRVASLLRQRPARIEGHTDSVGTPGRNLQLSQQRALAVRAWLAANEQLPATLFTVQGFGASRPVAPNRRPDGSDDPAGRQRNRRVEIIAAK
jgi:outer membrane protein OmpA-like peptidoglycan-associated protein